jgi:hypothetical protein
MCVPRHSRRGAALVVQADGRLATVSQSLRPSDGSGDPVRYLLADRAAKRATAS